MAKIDQKYHISTPPFEILLTTEEMDFLAVDKDPILKNKYITSQYYFLGNALSKCLASTPQEPPIGNWYQFAQWASLSAGTMINGQKIKSFSKLKRHFYWLAGKLKRVDKRKAQQYFFSITNNLIGLEMIPLGRTFLQMFCGKNQTGFSRTPFLAFEKIFTPKNPQEEYLMQAFRYYYRAKFESHQKKKMELIALAAVYQVYAEQMRVDKLIKLVFTSHFWNRHLNKYFKKMASKAGTLYLGTNLNYKIPLTKRVDLQNIHPLLTTLDNTEFAQLNDDSMIPNDLSGLRYYRPKKSNNWGDLAQRKRFLILMFRAEITNPIIFEPAYFEIAELASFASIADLNTFLEAL